MGLIRTLVHGRKDGLRSRLRARVGQTPAAPVDDVPPPPAAEASLGLSPEPPRDVNPPDGFEVILHKDALAPGVVTEIIIGGTAIAVANIDGGFYAVDNACPHAGGPLGEGELSGRVLTCPYHGWQFDLVTGDCLTSPDVQVTRFETRVVGDAVCVRL